jgi:hypothetical protein
MKKLIKENAFDSCGCQPEIENFSDDVRNTTVGELLQQIEGNDQDLYMSLVQWLREHYQEFNDELEGSQPAENFASLDDGIVGDIKKMMNSGMGLGGGQSISTRGPGISRGHGLGPCGRGDRMGPRRGIAMIRIRRESKKAKKKPNTKLMIEAFKDLKKNNLI